MLDPDEHRLGVRRHEHAGDLGLLRTHEEALDLLGGRVGGQHLVVAETGVGTGVDGGAGDVGLDPQPIVGVDVEAVGRAELVAVDVRPVGRDGRVSRQHEDVPDERGLVEIAGVPPADDVAVDVVGTGVGRVDLGRGAVGVVGEGDEDLELLVADVDPLRAVHLGGADGVGCGPGVDQDVGLGGEAGQGRVGLGEGDPLARAVRLELGHVQRALVEGVLALGERQPPVPVGDVAVDVLEALVVAHVHDDLLGPGLGDPRPLVLEAAEGGALDRHRRRAERVDLGDPSEAVGLVGHGVDLEAGVGGVPQVSEAAGADAVAGLQGVGGRRLAEVPVEVLLTGQVRAPRRVAHGAVVERAEDDRAGRVLRRLEEGVAGGGTGEGDGGGAGDAAGETGRPLDPPGAVHLLDLDDRDAVGGEGLGRLGRRPVGDAVGEEQAVVGVLVVLDDQAVGAAPPLPVEEQTVELVGRASVEDLGQQAAGGVDVAQGGEREVDEPVVVHTPLLGLLGGGVAGVGGEGGAVGDGVAPGDEDLPPVPGGHDHGVEGADGDGCEPGRRRGQAGVAWSSVDTPPPKVPATAAAATLPPRKERRETRASSTSKKDSLADGFETMSSSTMDMEVRPPGSLRTASKLGATCDDQMASRRSPANRQVNCCRGEDPEGGSAPEAAAAGGLDGLDAPPAEAGQLVLGQGVVEGGEAQVEGQAAGRRRCRRGTLAPVDVEQLDPLHLVSAG